MTEEKVSLGFKLYRTLFEVSWLGTEEVVDFDETDIFTFEEDGWNRIEKEIKRKYDSIFDMNIDVKQRKVWVSYIHGGGYVEYYIKEITSYF